MSRKVYPIRVARSALGIRAQDLRTLVRKAWWARRWVAAVEAFRLGARLGRGRQYAVNGQVTELRFQGPVVTAAVQGSREHPYEVRLEFTTPGDEALDRLSRRLLSKPVLLARLLTDDLPVEVEEMFAEEGCPLFPVAGVKPPYDVKMSCSCPDWMKPCKHVAAVMFLLGEEVTRRPATLLALRGLDLDSLIPSSPRPLLLKPTPLPTTPPTTTPPPGALISRLGPVPFWRGINRCVETLQKMYARQQGVAAAAAGGESVDLRR